MAAGLSKEPNNNSENIKKQRKEQIKKYLIRLIFINIPIVIFFVIPFLVRNYYIKNLKISEDIFLGAPEKINLVKVVDEKTKDVGPCYNVTINGYTFGIPEKFVPVKINNNSVEFRLKSSSEGRYIYVLAEQKTRKMRFKASFITRLFMPNELRLLFPLVLNANWHPYRLMFKAHLYSNEGINSKIFTANWGDNHIGYIFPSPGNEGYFGRIFRQVGDGTVEFFVSDSVTHVSLRDWVNIARLIKVPEKDKDIEVDDEKKEESSFLLDNIIEQAYDENKDSKILSIALNEYFVTKDAEWLIPIAIIMTRRGFIPEVLDLIKEYQSYFNEGSKYYSKATKILEKAVKESISIEIDPVSDVRALNIYCKNLTNLIIDNIKINITVESKFGTSQSFDVELLRNNTLLSKDEKQFHIKCPSSISLNNVANISYLVTALEFAK